MSISRWRNAFSHYRKRLGRSTGADFALALSAYIAEDRKRTMRHAAYGPVGTGRNRAKRNAYRKRSYILRLVYGKGRGRQTIHSPLLLLYKNKEDRLRDTINPKFNKSWVPISKRLKNNLVRSIDLKEFSFTRNPNLTMEMIRDIIDAASRCRFIYLNFTDKKCDDVAPYIVLSHVLKGLPPVFAGGMINKEVSAVLESVGLDKYLGINKIIGRKKKSDYPILPFKMAKRVPPGYFGDKDHQLRPQYKEFIADKFCEALEHWLGQYDYELSHEGQQLIVTSITEALDNAERHGHPDIDEGMGDWSMAGFSRLMTDADERERLECSVAIVSVGSTISDSLETAAQNVADRIAEYADRHTDGSAKTTELLRTLMAVQDGITRVEAASEARWCRIDDACRLFRRARRNRSR